MAHEFIRAKQSGQHLKIAHLLSVERMRPQNEATSRAVGAWYHRSRNACHALIRQMTYMPGKPGFGKQTQPCSGDGSCAYNRMEKST
eukprot:scaffold9104_cov40-Prasinocladus_malaysianus.AAC.1